MCTDWEMGQSYRRWKSKYGDGWEAKFRQKYEFEMIQNNDTPARVNDFETPSHAV